MKIYLSEVQAYALVNRTRSLWHREEALRQVFPHVTFSVDMNPDDIEALLSHIQYVAQSDVVLADEIEEGWEALRVAAQEHEVALNDLRDVMTDEADAKITVLERELEDAREEIKDREYEIRNLERELDDARDV